MFGLLAGAGEIGRGEMDRERLDKKKASAVAVDKGAPPKRKKCTHEEKTLPLKPIQQPKVYAHSFRHIFDVLRSTPFLRQSAQNTIMVANLSQSPPYHAPSPLPSHAQNGAHQSHHGVTNGVSPSKSTADKSLFFDCVKKHFDDKAKYHDFLKMLNMFTQEIIDSRTLVDRATFFLGDTNLLSQFKEILGYDDHDVIVEPDSGLRGNSSIVAALERPKVDPNDRRKYGPSYRKKCIRCFWHMLSCIKFPCRKLA